MERWQGRVALVTGASAGFGLAIAERLATLGMKVVGCARNIAKIQELAEKLKDAKGSLMAITCDVSKEDQILAMFQEIKSSLGGVHVCINNAGLSLEAPLLSGETEQWRTIWEVNVLGLMICTREAVRSMKEQNVDDGHIVHINSMSGHRVLNSPSVHMYAASKFAVTALTEGHRNELLAMGSHIRVTSISPGLANTEFSLRMYSGDEGRASARHNEFECLTADDIADSVVYALSAPTRAQIHEIKIRPTEGTY